MDINTEHSLSDEESLKLRTAIRDVVRLPHEQCKNLNPEDDDICHPHKHHNDISYNMGGSGGGPWQAVFEEGDSEDISSFEADELPYEYGKLEPFIDNETMKVHYEEHYKGYIEKLNKAIEDNEMKTDSIESLMKNISQSSKDVRDNGGGYYNHSLFWKSIAPGGTELSGDLQKAIDKQFGSLEKLKEKFENVAKERFGSGWVWLTSDEKGKLQIASTPNQDNPIMDIYDIDAIPILCLDVWEHAYYIKYRNKKDEYIASFWEVADWASAEERYINLTD